ASATRAASASTARAASLAPSMAAISWVRTGAISIQRRMAWNCPPKSCSRRIRAPILAGPTAISTGLKCSTSWRPNMAAMARCRAPAPPRTSRWPLSRRIGRPMMWRSIPARLSLPPMGRGRSSRFTDHGTARPHRRTAI
ncbi:hypothetical protein KXW36_001624, partial [Aspergillus fumigatus]